MDINLLVIKSKQGDGDAFWKLIEPKRQSLYRTAFWYAKNESDAMDIVSEAVYKAYISLHQLKNNDLFYTWLVRILIHCAFDFLKARTDACVQTDNIPDIVSERSSNSFEDILDLHNAIDTLDEKHRTVIVLKYLEDMTIDQVSQVLSIPVGTVKTYLHRALLHLRMKMEEA